MPANLVRNVRVLLTLFAGFLVGIHVAVFLHELGHALGCMLAGGVLTRIVMFAPLPAGYVTGSMSQSFLCVWGGVTFGSCIVVVPLFFARRFQNRPVLRFALLMVATFCFAHNGQYLFGGSLEPFADARDMVGFGAPRLLLFLLSLPLLIGCIVVLANALRMVDLSPTVAFWKSLVLVEGGLLTFPVLMVLPFVLAPGPNAMRLPMLLLLATYGVCFAMAAWLARRRSSFVSSAAPLSPDWNACWKLIAVAVLLIAFEWLAFRPK